MIQAINGTGGLRFLEHRWSLCLFWEVQLDTDWLAATFWG
jgi:hypothetical protein